MLINSAQGFNVPSVWFVAAQDLVAHLHPSHTCGSAKIDFVSLETPGRGIENYPALISL
jgi:hypothetical protein